MQQTKPTYDEARADAPLVVCATCGKAYYMTPVMEQCIPCQQGKGKA